MLTQLATRENIVAVSFAQEIADQAPPDEIAVITAGKYFYGDEEMAILPVDLEEAIRYWAERGIDPVIDYQHESFIYAKRAEAAGWIDHTSAWIENDQIHVKVRHWTPQAIKAIRDGEFRYLSPGFFMNWRTNTGRIVRLYIQHVALTNTPFLENLTDLMQIAASEIFATGDVSADGSRERTGGIKEAQVIPLTMRETKKENEKMISVKILAELGLEKDATEADALAKIAELKQSEKPEIPADIVEAAGAEAGAPVEEVAASIRSLRETTAKVKTEYVPRSEHDRLKNEFSTFRATKQVEDAATAGKILPAEKEVFTELALKEPALFEKMIAARTGHGLFGQKIEPGSAAVASSEKATKGVDPESVEADRKIKAIAAERKIPYGQAMVAYEKERGGK